MSWAASSTTGATSNPRVSHGPAAVICGCWWSAANYFDRNTTQNRIKNLSNNLRQMKCFTFRQSWKTAKPTEMTNEKNDNCNALNALMPKIPRPSGTSVIAFNNTKVKIGMAIFFNFDFLDSDGALSLNLILKSTSSFSKLRDEIVTFESAIGNLTETSLRWTNCAKASMTSPAERPLSTEFFWISTSPKTCVGKWKINKMIQNVQEFSRNRYSHRHCSKEPDWPRHSRPSTKQQHRQQKSIAKSFWTKKWFWRFGVFWNENVNTAEANLIMMSMNWLIEAFIQSTNAIAGRTAKEVAMEISTSHRINDSYESERKVHTPTQLNDSQNEQIAGVTVERESVQSRRWPNIACGTTKMKQRKNEN